MPPISPSMILILALLCIIVMLGKYAFNQRKASFYWKKQCRLTDGYVGHLENSLEDSLDFSRVVLFQVAIQQDDETLFINGRKVTDETEVPDEIAQWLVEVMLNTEPVGWNDDSIRWLLSSKDAQELNSNGKKPRNKNTIPF